MKWDLWTNGTRLRGANVWQSLEDGKVGPEYTDEDFAALRAAGANYVQLSHPGTFSEQPPYRLVPAAQESLDRLVARAGRAGLYAVIAFRTGPGRNEAGFDPNERSRAVHAVWGDPEAQRAWAEMWRDTARRYRDTPHVVGYELLLEPNGNDEPLRLLSPGEFYPRHRGSSYDWNPFAKALTAAVRSVDPRTPLLVGAMNYSDVEWLPYLEPTGDSRTVYVIHHYAPFEYTHQTEGRPPVLVYPGPVKGESVDRDWLAAHLAPAAAYARRHGVPIAVTEFGVATRAEGAARFLDDLVGLFERFGWNHALWMWEPAAVAARSPDKFGFRASPLETTVRAHWRRNLVSP